MVLENISIEEHIAALATKSVADRLRVIAAISGGLVEEDISLVEDAPVNNLQDSPALDDTNECAKSTTAVNESNNETTGIALSDLFGAWKDIDKGWEAPIEEMIKESHVSKIEAPNFDI